MSLYVNNNVVSLTAQRNLISSTNAQSKSLERLSSGLRINRAGDDAAGLAISESLRSQIRGLNQAVRNGQDGLSLISTAEGAMNEVTNILQRMRELAVQSSNDTNSASNRSALQDEVSQLVSELDRIATSIQFNGRNLLDGSFTDSTLQVGANRGQSLTFSIGNLKASNLGQVAEETGSSAVNTTAIAGSGDLTINGETVGASASDGVSTVNADASAIAKATAINSISGLTGVTATANAVVVTGSAAVTGGSFDASNYLTINGENIGDTGLTFNGNDAGGALRNAINAKSNITGVTATIDSSNQLVLTASDGRNVDVAVTEAVAGNVTNLTHVTAGTTLGTITLTSVNQSIQIGGTAGNGALLGFASDDYAISIDATTAINRIDISTAAGAQVAIQRVDAALTMVSEERSSLGALTNRLESTIANLRTTSENLTASESRIRDADFAAETAALTRSQILQQAGVSILAQANVTPQAALALLQ